MITGTSSRGEQSQSPREKKKGTEGEAYEDYRRITPDDYIVIYHGMLGAEGDGPGRNSYRYRR